MIDICFWYHLVFWKADFHISLGVRTQVLCINSLLVCSFWLCTLMSWQQHFIKFIYFRKKVYYCCIWKIPSVDITLFCIQFIAILITSYQRKTEERDNQNYKDPESLWQNLFIYLLLKRSNIFQDTIFQTLISRAVELRTIALWGYCVLKRL